MEVDDYDGGGGHLTCIVNKNSSAKRSDRDVKVGCDLGTEEKKSNEG